MQVAKYWRNKKLRYRLEGLPRQEARVLDVIEGPPSNQDNVRDNVRKVRKPLKREAIRLVQSG